MKIKKYVLLDDKRIVEICGKTKFGYEYVDSKTENGIVVTRTILEDKIIKSSDNILDLVEVGDLVEHKMGIDLVNEIHNESGLVITLHDTWFKNGIVIYENIKAIYKKQPNGDYKKYEVE